MPARVPKDLVELRVLPAKKTKDVMCNGRNEDNGKCLEDQSAEHGKHDFTDEQIAWDSHPVEWCDERAVNGNLVAIWQILFHLTAP